MKKLLVLMIFIASHAVAQDGTAGPWDLFVQQVNGDVTGTFPMFIHPPASSNGILVFQTGTFRPFLLPYTGVFTITSGTLTIDGSQISGITSSQIVGLIQSTTSTVPGLTMAPSGTTIVISGTPSAVNPGGTSGQYMRGDGTLATFPTTGTGSVINVSATSATLTLTGSPITSSGTLNIGLPNVGTAGNYASITTDAQGRVSAGNIVTSGTVLRVSGTAPSSFQVSTTQDSLVCYNFTITNSVNIISLTSVFGQVELQTSPNNSAWTTVGRVRNATTVGLAVALSLTDTVDLSITGYIPAGYYVRLLRTGAATITDLVGTETKF